MKFNKQKQIDSLKKSIQTLKEKNEKIENGLRSLCRLFDNTAKIIPYPFEPNTTYWVKFCKEFLLYTYKGELKCVELYTDGNLIDKVTDKKIIIKNNNKTFTFDKDAEVMIDITEEINNAVSNAISCDFIMLNKGE